MALPKRPYAMYRVVPFTNPEHGTVYVLMASDYQPIIMPSGHMIANQEADKLKATYTHTCHALGLTPIEVVNT